MQLMDKNQAGFYSFLNVCHKKLTAPLEGGGGLHTVLLVCPEVCRLRSRYRYHRRRYDKNDAWHSKLKYDIYSFLQMSFMIIETSLESIVELCRNAPVGYAILISGG